MPSSMRLGDLGLGKWPSGLGACLVLAKLALRLELLAVKLLAALLPPEAVRELEGGEAHPGPGGEGGSEHAVAAVASAKATTIAATVGGGGDDVDSGGGGGCGGGGSGADSGPGGGGPAILGVSPLSSGGGCGFGRGQWGGGVNLEVDILRKPPPTRPPLRDAASASVGMRVWAPRRTEKRPVREDSGGWGQVAGCQTGQMSSGTLIGQEGWDGGWEALATGAQPRD